MSATTVYRLAASLEAKGWLVLLAPKVKNKPTLYQPLTHDKWVSAHGSEDCFDVDEDERPSPPVAMEDEASITADGDTIPARGDVIPKIESSITKTGSVHPQNEVCPSPPVAMSSVLAPCELRSIPVVSTVSSFVARDEVSSAAIGEIDSPVSLSGGQPIPADQADICPPVPTAPPTLGGQGWDSPFFPKNRAGTANSESAEKSEGEDMNVPQERTQRPREQWTRSKIERVATDQNIRGPKFFQKYWYVDIVDDPPRHREVKSVCDAAKLEREATQIGVSVEEYEQMLAEQKQSGAEVQQ
jgi:hypothetical protein